jgi:hypothetical protein
MNKVCGICGEDCSDRPRVKDAKGRYFCKACAMDKVAQPEKPAAPAASTGDDGDPYSLDEADPGAAPLPIEMLDYAEQGTQCPGCMRTMPAGAKVCVSCGYNVEKGIQSSTLVEKSGGKRGRKYQCRECGYDLRGLRSAVCPECGTPMRLSKTDKKAQRDREMMIEEWKKPAIWFAIGFVAMMFIYFVSAGPVALIAYPVYLAVQVLVGYCVLWMCFSFLGDTGTPLLNFARLAGIYAIVDLVGFFAGFIPFLGWIITLIFYIGFFADLFDTDWQDAFLVIFLTGAVKIGLMVLFVIYLPGIMASLL